MAHNTKKSEQDFQWLNNTVLSCLPDGWDTIHVVGHWECQNNFRGILYPNYYCSPTTNVVYISKEAKIAHTHKMVPMNPKQLRLLIHIVLDGGPSMTMQEHIHTTLLLWEFYRISFFCHAMKRDRTMCCVLDINLESIDSCLPKGVRHWLPAPLPLCASAMLRHANNNTWDVGLS